ncbi:MAG TPA: ABC-2 family transporter protein [Patescibacteria group bacterium]|nr:ABC-2 family transporter protein [Patescibacteria group bacterium]
MKKYWQITKNTWDETLTYRTSFIVYRLRELLQLVATYFLWLFVVPAHGSFLGYTQAMMLTYVIGSAFVSDIVFSSRTSAIAGEINEGVLNNFLVRPLSYLRYYFARDLGDKAMNVTFSLIELSLIVIIFHIPFYLQHNLVTILLFFITTFLAMVLNFFISVLISLIGFWSNEGWGPRFIFYSVIGFLSGGMFPLDILPRPIFTIFQLLPFSSLSYFPVKIYLGQFDGVFLLRGEVTLVVWIAIMYVVTMKVWNKGLHAYTAQGI